MPRSANRSRPNLIDRSSPSSDRALERSLLSELARIYDDADAAFSGWSCPASTECCRFGITGREPYVTSIELLAVVRSVAALGGPKALTGKRALPIAKDERTCPMLTVEGRCSIYASRPLGCRTFYCERASEGAPVKHKDVTALVRRVKDLAMRHAPEGDLGRPLTRALLDKH